MNPKDHALDAMYHKWLNSEDLVREYNRLNAGVKISRSKAKKKSIKRVLALRNKAAQLISESS